MPVETAVEAKVAQVRRNPLLIGRVVTEDGQRYAFAMLHMWQLRNCIGNVAGKFVVSADVYSHMRVPNPKRSRLPRTLKMQQSPPAGIWIFHHDPSPIPALATKVRLFRVACV